MLRKCYLKVRAQGCILKHKAAPSQDHRFTLWHWDRFYGNFTLASADY